jgi:hypothetical protein
VSRGPRSLGTTAEERNCREERRRIVRRITEAVVPPFRRADIDSTGTGRNASDSGRKERQEADGDVLLFRVVPPTGFEPVPPP